MTENICIVVFRVLAKNCRKPKTGSSKKHILIETLQSVQSVELFNINKTPRTRERHGQPRSAWQPKIAYIYLKNAPDL